MALFERAEAGRFCHRPRVWCAFIEANAESLDRFFPPLPDRCLKRGHSHEERNWVHFLMAVRLYAREDKALRGSKAR